jgi:hypothetical protein
VVAGGCLSGAVALVTGLGPLVLAVGTFGHI